jgi:hypothetical protein
MFEYISNFTYIFLPNEVTKTIKEIFYNNEKEVYVQHIKNKNYLLFQYIYLLVTMSGTLYGYLHYMYALIF